MLVRRRSGPRGEVKSRSTAGRSSHGLRRAFVLRPAQLEDLSLPTYRYLGWLHGEVLRFPPSCDHLWVTHGADTKIPRPSRGSDGVTTTSVSRTALPVAA